MRGMNSSTVDLIYLDPPFNSKANYAAPIGSRAAGAEFKDTWTLQDVDIAWLDLIEAKHPALNRVIHAAMTPSDKSYLIYMAVRLLEMKRLMKPTGSIYLHCDDTAAPHLRLLMDSIFGTANFRSQIIYRRATSHNDGKQGRMQYGRIYDVLLYYSAGRNWTWNPIYTEYDRAYVESNYRHVEAGTNRRYQKDNLTAAKPGGDTLYDWRVKRPAGGQWESDLTDEWKAPRNGWEYRGVPPYNGRSWAYSKENMREFAASGRLVYAKTGMPRYKRYLDEMPGVPLQNLWADISPALGKERLGYPTQKPLALLDRIIRASSNEGDMILDPFCGCATACIAAAQLQREWVGIDVSPKAAELVRHRMEKELGLFYRGAIRTDIPQRTDIGPLRRYNHPDNKKHLYGEQGGKCNGCKGWFRPQNMTIDHITARSAGGGDHLENLQLLCGHCNSVKGDRGQEYLIARLAAA